MSRGKTQTFELKLDNGQTREVASLHKKVVRKDTGPWYYLGFIGNLGISLVVPIAGGAFLGTTLDKRWGTHPRATLALLFLGFIVSVLNLYMTVRTIIKRGRSPK